MPGDLRLLPRREARIGLLEQLFGLGLEPPDLGVDVDFALGRGLAKLRHSGLELGDRLFEV